MCIYVNAYACIHRERERERERERDGHITSGKIGEILEGD